MTDLFQIHEDLSPANKKLVGLRQEMLLRQDPSGGEDGMWFERSLNDVSEDAHKVIEQVAAFFNVSLRDIETEINK